MAKTKIEDLGTILGIWAHPDDETYLMAGIMATAIGNGQEVACITATRGELGSFDPVRWPTKTLGGVREKELMKSLQTLGVANHYWLNYPDGGCDKINAEEAIGKIVAIMDVVRPDSVLTFGPEGMTGHDDHKAVQSWALAAFNQTAPPGARLYYATHTPEWYQEFEQPLKEFDVFFNIEEPPKHADHQLALNPQFPDDILDLKIKAMQAHESQVEGMIKTLGEDFFRRGMREEPYWLGATKS